MINGVENLFMYLLAICMSSWEKISIQVLCHLKKNDYFVAVVEFIYILDISFLSDMWFANISSVW